MTRDELCAFLWLPPDACAPLVRSAVKRVLSPATRIGGASSGRRDELARRLGLSNTALPIAIQTVVNLILARPLAAREKARQQ